MQIFKIVGAAEWREAEHIGEYAGSAKDRADGFLHFSHADQVTDTLAKHYAGANDLMLVCVAAERLGSALKLEPSREGSMFPHLYGTLTLSTVIWAKPIRSRAGGTFELPPELDAARR